MSDDLSIPSPTYRVPRHRGADPATRRLAMIAACIGGGLVVVAGGWSMLGGGPHTVPVIAAQAGPVRVKPVHPGGLQVQGLGNDIFSGSGGSTVDKLAPPPEVPDPQALRAPPPPAPASREPATTAPAAIPAPMPQPPVIQSASAAVPRAAATPARHTVTGPATRTVARQPAAAQPAPAARQTGGGAVQVQLAALSSQAAARSEWNYLTRRAPGLLSGRQPEFRAETIGGHVFWQVRTGGFASRADAAKFCQRVRTQGLACYLPET